MAIDTMDALVSALRTSQALKISLPLITTATGGFTNISATAGNSFGTLAQPGNISVGGTVFSKSSPGFPNFSNAPGGQTSYIGAFGAAFGAPGSLHLLDFIWGCSGFSGTLTSAQAITGFPSLASLAPRAVPYTDLELWVVSFTAPGATASNITVQYTNAAGTSGRNTLSTALIPSMPATRMFQVPLQVGGEGIQSIQSVTLSASTGTAGNFGLILCRRITAIGTTNSNVFYNQDFISLGGPTISDDSCLAFIHQGTGTSSGIIQGILRIAQG